MASKVSVCICLVRQWIHFITSVFGYLGKNCALFFYVFSRTHVSEQQCCMETDSLWLSSSLWARSHCWFDSGYICVSLVFYVSPVSGSQFGVSPEKYKRLGFDWEMISGECFCLQARKVVSGYMFMAVFEGWSFSPKVHPEGA